MTDALFWIATIALLMVVAVALAYELGLIGGGTAAGLSLMVLSAGVSTTFLWLLAALAIVMWGSA